MTEVGHRAGPVRRVPGFRSVEHRFAVPLAPGSEERVELFVRELRTLVDALGIGERFRLLGQSWGGMLAPEFVLADGAGVVSMTSAEPRGSRTGTCSTASAPRRSRTSS